MTKKITKSLVDRTQPGSKDVIVRDSDLTGFGVKITPAGRRVYFVDFRTRGDHRKKRITLGAHGVLTPDIARREAKKILGTVAAGHDPSRERREQKEKDQPLTLRELAHLYLSDHVAIKTKPRSQVEYARLIDRYILPALGRRVANDIGRPDVARFHHAMRSTKFQANRCVVVLSAMYGWAEKHGYIEEGRNPCRGIEKNEERRRRRYLKPNEFRRLLTVLDEIEGEMPYPVAAIRLLIYTGARLNEILTAEWDFVRGSTLHLPDSKSGEKEVDLCDEALEVLAGLRAKRTEGHRFIVPGRLAGRPLRNLQAPWAMIRERAGIPDVRLHDLRHSWASVAVGLGAGLPLIGGALGHASPATTAIYAHVDVSPRQLSSVSSAPPSRR